MRAISPVRSLARDRAVRLPRNPMPDGPVGGPTRTSAQTHASLRYSACGHIIYRVSSAASSRRRAWRRGAARYRLGVRLAERGERWSLARTWIHYSSRGLAPRNESTVLSSSPVPSRRGWSSPRRAPWRLRSPRPTSSASGKTLRIRAEFDLQSVDNALSRLIDEQVVAQPSTKGLSATASAPGTIVNTLARDSRQSSDGLRFQFKLSVASRSTRDTVRSPRGYQVLVRAHRWAHQAQHPFPLSRATGRRSVT